MSMYINESEQWGDRVPVSADDYRAQAGAFGLPESVVEEQADGIYVDGERVASPATPAE